MTIRYKCEECGAALNIKDELAGTKGNCPRCQVEFIVPAPEGGVVEKSTASVAAEAAPERAPRGPDEPLSEDDIGSFLTGGPEAPRADRHLSDADNDAGNGEDFDDEPRVKRRKSRGEDEEVGDDAAADDDIEDEPAESRPKKKKRTAKPAAKSDSAESASIARNLMARGEKAPPRDEKKGGRPFGGADGARDEDREEYGAKEVAGYFFKQSWPYLVGGVAFMGLCYMISSSLFRGIELPPLAQVTGTVTLDGKPLPKATVRFQPVLESSANANLRLATSFGFTDQDGKFILQYALIDGNEIRGAAIGKHLVVINVNNDDGSERLPPIYSNTAQSVLKQDVVKGMPPVAFNLTSGSEPPAK